MSSSVPDARPPRLRRRRMSAPPPRAAPPRLPPCRPLPLSLEALDLSPASPTQALASLRFLVLSYLADLERRLCQFESAEWASTALDMLHAIRADVRSHLPDLGAHLPDMDDLKSRFDFAALDFDFDFDFAGLDFLPDMPLGIAELKALVARQWADLDLTLDFSRPLSYVPTLAARLRRLHAHLHDSDLITTPKFEQLFDFDFDLKARAPARLAEVLEAFLAELPRLSSLPSLSLPPSLSSLSLPLEDADDEVARALARSQHGSTLIGYDDLPDAWRNNPYVLHGYRFIPLRRWDKLVASVAGMHNETLNIHTHLVPLVLWGAAYAGAVWPYPTAAISSLPEWVSAPFSLLATPLAWILGSIAWITSLLPAWLTHDAARYTPFGVTAATPPLHHAALPPDEALFALFALACLASSALWHTMAGCAHRGTMETCARVDYVGIGWLIATSIATVVHHGYACAEAAVDATPLGHAVLHPGAALHSAGALLQEGASSASALLHEGASSASALLQEGASSASALLHEGAHSASVLLHAGEDKMGEVFSAAVRAGEGKMGEVLNAASEMLHDSSPKAAEAVAWVDAVEIDATWARGVVDLAASSFGALPGALGAFASGCGSAASSLLDVPGVLFASTRMLLDLTLTISSALLAWCIQAPFDLAAAAERWAGTAQAGARAFLAYHPIGAACLMLCLVCGVSGNVLPFSEWFNRVENRLWRTAFFVGISFSALAPLLGIAALQGWGAMVRFVAPVGPSLAFYIVGLFFYATQIPERFLTGRLARVGRVLDWCGGGSHAIWHLFIVLAMRAHRDGIREMRRQAAEGGCAAGVGVGA